MHPDELLMTLYKLVHLKHLLKTDPSLLKDVHRKEIDLLLEVSIDSISWDISKEVWELKKPNYKHLLYIPIDRIRNATITSDEWVALTNGMAMAQNISEEDWRKMPDFKLWYEEAKKAITQAQSSTIKE